MNVTEWATWKSAGHRNVTYVGMSGDARVRGTLLTVSKSGLRVRTENGINRFHPEDVRPGWA